MDKKHRLHKLIDALFWCVVKDLAGMTIGVIRRSDKIYADGFQIVVSFGA